jgi:hypothetical protein
MNWEDLPELSLGYPPDLRAIAAAGDTSRPVRWNIEIVEDPRSPDVRKSIGEAETSSHRQPDGWFKLTSSAEFDAGGLLNATPFRFRSRGSVRIQMSSIYHVDPSGNLRAFDMKVGPRDMPDSLFKIKGRLKNGNMEVESSGPIEMLNQHTTFAYEERSVLHDSLGPMDRLPGLHLGQRWDMRVVNPLTGKVEQVRVEVQRRTLIHWNGEPVSTFEVVQHAGPVTSKTWVRTDGTILRQEVPFPFVKLVLDRRPDESATPIREGAAP